MYTKRDKKTGRITVHKIPYEEGTVDDRDLYRQYVNGHLENRVRRTDLGEEIDDRAKELRDSLKSINRERNSQQKAFKTLDSERNGLFNKLPRWARGMIVNVNKDYNTKAKKEGTVVDIREAYPEMTGKLNTYLENHNVEGDDLANVQRYVELLGGLTEIMDTQEELASSATGERQQFSDDIRQLVEQAKEEYFHRLEEVASDAGLMGFEEFTAQPHVKKLSRRARNNYILDRMINIMNDESSREEQYSRSQFENLAAANDLINRLSGDSGRMISPYNPLTQLSYFDDTMSGARLKALSVNWDTFISRCNLMHAELDPEAAIDVVLQVEGNSAADSSIAYDINELRASYGDDISTPVEGGTQQQHQPADDSNRKFYLDDVDGHQVWMTKARIQAIQPLVQAAFNDDRVIYIPWREFAPFNYRQGNIQTTRLISRFIYGNLQDEWPAFSKGEVAITRALYDLVKAVSPQEFFALMNDEEVTIRIRDFEGDIKKGRTITKQVINKFLKDNEGVTDEQLADVIRRTSRQGYGLTSSGGIYPVSRALINDKSFQRRWPKAYEAALAIYNWENGIRTPVEKQSKTVMLKARKLGWSNTNRNITGDYVTNSTAETTAHHLDAVKEGSIPNVNEYTFNVYKFLTCIGLDHEFSIGFMRQPIMSRLVANYNLTNSVYFGGNNNPVNMTILDIGTQLGLTYQSYGGTNLLTKDNSVNQALDALKANNDFATAFNNLFGIDISDMKNSDILNLKVPLDKRLIFNRIKNAAREGSQMSNDITQTAFDFGMVLLFRHMNTVTNSLNNMMQAANTDKVGAKPSLRETRRVRDSVAQLRNDNTLTVNGENFINALYPVDSEGNIDIDKSANKPVAAAYASSTLPSLEVGQQIFIMERESGDPTNPGYVEAEEQVQRLIGHRFNEQEAKEYKRYVMNYLYNQLPILFTPVTVDERGRIRPFEDAVQPREASNYWDEERSRVVGYGVVDEGNFTCADVNNPTAEEIAQYIKLTPAQKVIFIQRNFPDRQGIFNYIKVTLLNNWDKRNRGITRQYLAYDDQADSIEDLYDFFTRSFSNTNPLIKLAAVDLVKYAFIAEGFNFKSGYITKIIPNDVLYTDREQGGMDIIDNDEGIFAQLDRLPARLVEREFVEEYVRSHSEIYRPANLGNVTYDIDQYTGEEVMQPSIGRTFRRATRADGLVVLPACTPNEQMNNLISKLALKNKVGQYMKVDFPVDANRRDTVLYRVEARNQNERGDYKDFFLIPMNLLEPSETYDISYNEGYNRFNTAEYYDDLVDRMADEIESYRTDKNMLDAQAVAEANRANPGERQQIGTYRPSTGNLQEAIESPYFLQGAAISADAHLAGGARMMLNDIRSQMLPRIDQGNMSGMYLLNNNAKLATYLPVGQSTNQIITDGDTTYNLTIAHCKPGVRKLIADSNNRKGRKPLRYADETAYALQVSERTKTSPANPYANYYYVTVTKQAASEQDRIMQAATDQILDTDPSDIPNTSSDAARRGNPIDNVSASIIKQVTYDARKNNSSIAQQFVREMTRRGVSRNYRGSLIENRRGIYTAAARYYRSAANSLINALNGFEITDAETGETTTYDMSTEAMYDALAKNDRYFAEVARIILDAVTFGNRIDAIMSLDLAFEDNTTREAVESIRNSIKSVRNNAKVGMAMNNLINIYFRKYSTNPMVTEGLMNIRDQFGDIDVAMKLISDPAEINNAEVQVILREVYSMFSRAEMFDTQRNVKEWQDALAEIDRMSERLDMSKIIDSEHGMLRQDFNQQYLDDRQKLIDDLNEAKQHRFDSVDAFERYLRAQYARDEFMYKHTEQPIMDEYYKEELANRFEVMQQAGKAYFEYRMLSAQLYDMENRSVEETDEATANEKERIKRRMQRITSINEVDGSEKSPDAKRAAEAITKFVTRRREINKKYFNTQEYDGFQQDYQRYSGYVKSYDRANMHKSLEEKMQDVEYREAYNWIKNNGHIAFTDEAGDRLSEAFKKLSGRTERIPKMTLARIRKVEGAIDENGNINPLALNDAQIAQLRNEEQNELGEQYANGDGEMILIKSVPRNTQMTFADKKKVKYKRNPVKAKAIARINEIVGKAVNRDSGMIEVATLFNNDYVTDAEREELVQLYQTVRNETVPYYEDRRYKMEFNRTQYNTDMAYYNEHLRNTKQGRQFLGIFCQFRDGKLDCNEFIYGYKQYYDEFIDHERTDAFNFIQDNVEFVPTDYYYQALRQATENGTYEEWYNANHVYNPFTHRWQPLRIWTTMQARPDSELAKSVTYVPSFDNVERSVKPEYINNEENRRKAGLAGRGYSEFGHNYKKGDSRYDSGVELNAKEQALKDLIQKTLNKYATTYQGRRFVGQGYLPRERTAQVNGRWALGQVASFLGASWHSGRDSDSFNETVDYSHDREADMKMLQLLKGKGTKEYLHLPNRADYDTEEKYQTELKRVRDENRKIAEENRKIDMGLISRDWRKVMEDFVYNATIFNSRQAAKPYLYLLLEDLAMNDAYMIKGIWNKRLSRDIDTSTTDDPQFRRVRQNNARDLIHNLARRLLFSQYHEGGAMRNVANFLQNITSAKYMVFNLYGGVANVTTGRVNIAMEKWANEYFGFSEVRSAERQYLSHLPSLIAGAFTENSPNLTAALCKQFHVVDFDQILQFGATADDLDARMRRLRDFMYSFQSAGEHYMQNTVMLAMLKSNRLYTDDKGVRRIGDFKDFTSSVERQAMRDVLAGNQDLAINYEAYLNSIRAYDIQTRMDVSTGRKDINRNFLYSLRDNKDANMQALYRKTAEAYHRRRNELMKDAKTKFLQNRTVESLYEFRDGKAVIKQEAYEDFKKYSNNPVGDLEHLIGGLREKIKAVNKKIHGVYDKDGAAMIENKWFGSLLMQYHKHLPMGIWKRFRRKGYYNEFRGSMERGTYQTFMDFLGTEFTNFKARRKNIEENGTNVCLASIQVAMEGILNTFTNMSFNWKNLNNAERANMRRLLGECGGVLAACAVVLALYGFSDDDDINDDRFKASLLYLADRLYTETTMYSPQGLISEFKTNWSSPVAGMSTINDAMKLAVLIPQALFDPDFEPEYQTGRYAGMNKFDVLWKRNTVGLRNFDRVMTIGKSNSYYKIDKSQLGISWARNFGDAIAGR